MRFIMYPKDQAHLYDFDRIARRNHLFELLATLDDERLEEVARHAGVLVGTVDDSMAKRPAQTDDERETHRGSVMPAESSWREIARELAQALAAVPNEHVWRDYAEGVSAARHAVDFWRDEIETIGERWQAAEQATGL
jgi:hypothetical protein